MQKILANRAQHFPTVEKAIEWSVKGGPLRNIESARVSIPSTLKYDESRKCYTYHTPLEETEKYWKGWYEGLSDKFLSCPVQKILLLAGTDRLDRGKKSFLSYLCCGSNLLSHTVVSEQVIAPGGISQQPAQQLQISYFSIDSYSKLVALVVKVTHLLGVLGFGTFCYLLGASKLLQH